MLPEIFNLFSKAVKLGLLLIFVQTNRQQTVVIDSCTGINQDQICFNTVRVHGIIIPPEPLKVNNGLIIPPKPLQNSSYVSQLKIVINVSNWKLLREPVKNYLAVFFC